MPGLAQTYEFIAEDVARAAAFHPGNQHLLAVGFQSARHVIDTTYKKPFDCMQRIEDIFDTVYVEPFSYLHVGASAFVLHVDVRLKFRNGSHESAGPVTCASLTWTSARCSTSARRAVSLWRRSRR